METPRITRRRQLRFLAMLAKSGSVAGAAMDAHLDRGKLEQARDTDRAFAAEWKAAERAAAFRLEHEAWRRAIDGVPEPLISEGKIVRDDDGQPLSVRRYSDALLIELLRMARPRRLERSEFWISMLRSPLVKHLTGILVPMIVLLIVLAFAMWWLKNHLFVAAFH